MSDSLPLPAAPRWTGDVQAARAEQEALARQVSLRDGYPKRLATVAGLDVGFVDEGATTRAAAVMLDAVTLQPIASHVVHLPTTMPYVPGLLSFRELPALLDALEGLPAVPDLVLVDGQGIAHPRRLGIAAHLGVVTGLPAVGVAKKKLLGDYAALHDMRGAFTPLRVPGPGPHPGEQIGWALRSKPGCLPLFVSPGHRVSMASCAELVMSFVTNYRLPEPTRLADRLASQRGDVEIRRSRALPPADG